MATFKYVCAVFLRINDLEEQDRRIMGWILVVLDVLFMVSSVVVFVLMVVAVRAIGADALRRKEKITLQHRSLSQVQVVPV